MNGLLSDRRDDCELFSWMHALLDSLPRRSFRLPCRILPGRLAAAHSDPLWQTIMSLILNVNGVDHEITADPQTPLLYVLRNDLRLNAAKFGCGLGQCGSCTVVIDGKAATSCIVPIMLLKGRRITTLEGLGSMQSPGVLQQAFIDLQAAQCGYCIAGMMMRAHALLTTDPEPSDAKIRAALEPNLCRCGTHMRIIAAIRRASQQLLDLKQARH